MSTANFSRQDYDLMAGRRRNAFRTIAAKLGKEHAITKMMDSLSYGRHKYEQGPDGTLRSAIEEFAFLEGFFDALNLWARDHDPAAQRVMLDAWPRGRERAKP